MKRGMDPQEIKTDGLAKGNKINKLPGHVLISKGSEDWFFLSLIQDQFILCGITMRSWIK
jgi:hypothetical protein